MRTRTRTSLLSLLALAAVPLSACATDQPADPGVKVTPPDEDGQAERARAQGVVTGDLAAATEVRGSFIRDDGTTSNDPGASALVTASGDFSMDVSADQGLYLVQAYDASGELVGAAVLESTGAADSTSTVTPIGPESTVEAMAWLQAAADAGDTSSVSYGDVRGRIDASLAATVYADWRTGEGDASIEALSAAIHAAQQTEWEGYAEAGGTASAQALAEAELELSKALSQDLYAWIEAGNSSTADATDANGEFLNEIYVDATSEFGLDAESANEVNANSGLAFAAVVESMTGSSSETAEGAWVSWGELQAYLTGNATVDLYESMGASSLVVASVTTSGALFAEEADEAASADAMADAWADFYAETTASSDSALAETFQVTVIEESAFELALSDSRDARVDLISSVRSDVSSETTSGFDFASGGSAEAVADVVLDARAVYEQDVWTACSAIDTLSTADVDAMASIVTTVDGAYSFSR